MENIDKIKCVLIDFENNDKTLNEAANEILRLSDSWILLSEKKPDNKQEIIFFSDCVYVGVWWDSSNKVHGNEPGCYGCETEKKDITHWMPFPKKPICT